MSFHVKDDFKAGAPISQVPTSWFNAIAKFLNGLVGDGGIKTNKNESGVSTISLDKNALRDAGTPADHTDTGTDDDTDGDTWTWTPGGANGLKIDVYCKTEEDGSFHYLSRARFTFSNEGLLIKAEGLDGRREITA